MLPFSMALMSGLKRQSVGAKMASMPRSSSLRDIAKFVKWYICGRKRRNWGYYMCVFVKCRLEIPYFMALSVLYGVCDFPVFVCFYTIAECGGLESILHSKVLPGTTETVSWTSGMSSASSFSAPSSSSWKQSYSL